MNLIIIIIILVLLILYTIQSDIFKKITYINNYTIGITNNITINRFTTLFLKLLDTTITIKYYKTDKKLLEDLNNNTIDFGITNENNVLESQLGLNSYKNNKLTNLRYITGLYYNYQYLLTDIIYKDSNKTEVITSIDDIKQFYKIYDRNIIIGTEDTNSESFIGLIVLLYMYGFTPVNIKSKDSNKKYSKHTVFYANYNIDDLIHKFNKNNIDAIYLVNVYNYNKIRSILNEKDVIFLDITFKNTIFNDIFSNYFYNKTLTISNMDEDIDSTYTFETKANRILLIGNNMTDKNIVEEVIKKYYTHNNILINELLENNKKDIDHNTFEPIDMVYINKYIKLHEGAYKYMKSLGFIINENIKNKLEINKNENLKHYWKYDKIGLNTFQLN